MSAVASIRPADNSWCPSGWRRSRTLQPAETPPRGRGQSRNPPRRSRFSPSPRAWCRAPPGAPPSQVLRRASARDTSPQTSASRSRPPTSCGRCGRSVRDPRCRAGQSASDRAAPPASPSHGHSTAAPRRACRGMQRPRMTAGGQRSTSRARADKAPGFPSTTPRKARSRPRSCPASGRRISGPASDAGNGRGPRMPECVVARRRPARAWVRVTVLRALHMSASATRPRQRKW